MSDYREDVVQEARRIERREKKENDIPDWQKEEERYFRATRL